MSTPTLQSSEWLLAATGAALGALVASTGRVIPHPQTGRPWPYLLVGLTGLLMVAFEPTRAFGMGMAAYGLAKILVKTVYV